MLLPSALPLPCENAPSTFPSLSSLTTNLSSRPSRPSLRRFLPYNNSSIQPLSQNHNQTHLPKQPQQQLLPVYEDHLQYSSSAATPPPSPPQTHLTSNLQSTCRALHSILGVTPPPRPQPRTALTTKSQNRMNTSSPLTQVYSDKKRNILSPPGSPLPSFSAPPKYSTPSQSSLVQELRGGAKKRSRTLFESSSYDEDVENTIYPYVEADGGIDSDLDMEIEDYNNHIYNSAPSKPSLTFSSSRRPHNHSHHHHHRATSSSFTSSPLPKKQHFSTPKRRCRHLAGPLSLPFGLERGDFEALEA